MRNTTLSATPILLAIAVAAIIAGEPALAANPTPRSTPSAAPDAFATPMTVPVATATSAVRLNPSAERSLVLPAAPRLSKPAATSTILPQGDIVGDTGPFVGISSNDVVAMALARNSNLAISQSDRRIAGYRIVAAKGAYDLRFALEPQYQYQDNPSLSSFASGPSGYDEHQITRGLSASLGQNTGSGGSISLQSSVQAVHDDNIVNSYNDYYETSLGIVATQPLLRNRKIDDNRHQLQIAAINRTLTDDQALQSASDTISDVLIAYNNLIAGWKNVSIQEDSLRQAKAQSSSNERLVRAGRSAPVDVVESNTQVNVSQDNVYAAIDTVAQLQNQLKQLILSSPADPIWTANLVPTTPLDVIPDEPSVRDVMLAALKGRPEVAQLRDQIRMSDSDIAYQRDQTLPQVDLRVSASENGFAGKPAAPGQDPFASILQGQTSSINALIARSNAATPGSAALPMLPSVSLTQTEPFENGDVSTSYKNLFAGKFPQINATLTIGFPLQNRTAKAQLAIAQEQRNQSSIQEDALVDRIQDEARNAVQSFRSSRSRYIAAQAASVAAERVYEGELHRFRSGKSTTYLVLQREIELANDRYRDLQAETNLQNALVTIDHVSGNLSTKYDVSIERIGTVAPPSTPPLDRTIPR